MNSLIKRQNEIFSKKSSANTAREVFVEDIDRDAAGHVVLSQDAKLLADARHEGRVGSHVQFHLSLAGLHANQPRALEHRRAVLQSDQLNHGVAIGFIRACIQGQGALLAAGQHGAVHLFAVQVMLALGKLLQNDEYWNKETQQISVDEKGWIEIIPRYSGQRILLGEPKDLEEKLARVRLFYEKAMPKVGWNKYSIINAIYKDQVICKK